MADQRSHTVTELYGMANDLHALKESAKDIREGLERLEDEDDSSPRKFQHIVTMNRTIMVPRKVFVEAMNAFLEAVEVEAQRLVTEFGVIGIEPDVGEPDDD